MVKVLTVTLCIVLVLTITGQELRHTINLQQAVALAHQLHEEIAIAKNTTGAAQARVLTSLGLSQPAMSLSYEFIPRKSALNSFGERTFSITQAFEFPSVYYLRYNKSRAEVELAGQGTRQSILNVTAKVKSAYYDVLEKQYLSLIADENLAITEDFAHKAELRHELGEAANIELLTARVQFTEAVLKKQIVQNELLAARGQLAYAIGMVQSDTNEYLNVIDSLVFVNHELQLQVLLDAARSNNPVLQITEMNTRALHAEHSIAWSSLLPSFSVSYALQTNENSGNLYGVTFGMNVPLWFMFDNRGKIEESAARLDAARLEAQLANRSIKKRIETGYTEYQNAIRQARFYRNDLLPQSEKIFEIAAKSYDAGEMTYLEFLQAKQTLNQSRVTYAAALSAYYQAIIALEELTGLTVLE
ncbi:MAG: TolC family protein [Ignavibacteria bacterium]|nr:TolC family protein [Ignavibacteria bacterium]